MSSKVLTNLPNPSTDLIGTSLKKNQEKKFKLPDPAISLTMTFLLHTYTQSYPTTSVYQYVNTITLVYIYKKGFKIAVLLPAAPNMKDI
jgi:hypothetical protein